MFKTNLINFLRFISLFLLCTSFVICDVDDWQPQQIHLSLGGNQIYKKDLIKSIRIDLNELSKFVFELSFQTFFRSKSILIFEVLIKFCKLNSEIQKLNK